MRPLLLHGHTRPVTHVEYNREGDILFSTGKDREVIAWRTETGERLGTYDGHGGAVRHCSADFATARLATAGADECVRVWDVASGRELHRAQYKTSARCVDWCAGARSLLCVTDAVRGIQAHVYVNAWDDAAAELRPAVDVARYLPEQLRPTFAKFGPLNAYVLCAAEDGSMHVFDPEKQALVTSFKAHTKTIVQFAFDRYGLLFVTASKDGTARLYDARTFQLIKTFDTGRPVNAAAISPLRDEVLVCGGQEAGLVTTTNVDNAQFKAIFFDIVTQEEIGRVAGHFGPVNAAAFAPDGAGFVTGGEDGYVRLHRFDKAFYDTAASRH